MNLEDLYVDRCQRRSDINEHIPTLKKYAEKCDHITEMGVRSIVSTYGFLAGKPKQMVCIDINHPSRSGGNFPELVQVTEQENIFFEFRCADTLKIEIEETDLLFIDTKHTYGHLKKELELHGNMARKYIILHDTVTYGHVDMGCSRGLGLMPAINEFLENNPHWKIIEHFDNNNGLTVVGRDEQKV